MLGIKHHEKSIALDRPAFFVYLLQLLSIEEDPQAVGRMRIPIGIGHLPTARFEPGNILDTSAANASALEKPSPHEDRLCLAQPDEVTRKLQQVVLHRSQIPVEPTDFVVLAIGIVVAELSSSHLIATAEHGNSLRKHQGGNEVPLLFFPLGINRLVICRPFRSAIPAQVIVFPVDIILSVSFVVLVIVTDQIVKRESVVTGDKIDAGIGAASAAFIEVAASRQTCR